MRLQYNWLSVWFVFLCAARLYPTIIVGLRIPRQNKIGAARQFYCIHAPVLHTPGLNWEKITEGTHVFI